jgi:hypothetical protein
MKLRVTVRPSRPAWDIELKTMDLDSLSKIVEIETRRKWVLYYLQGWLDAGWHILGIDEVKE